MARGVVVSLLNDLDGLDGPFVLALDDYHVIESPEVHDAMTFLLDHLPAYVAVAITTRADPPLPVARLRTRGELLELRAADLRFTQREAAAFLNDVMGLDLEPGHVDALESRTEGWAAGLQLAALSLRNRGDAGEFIAAFTGSHRFVLDYLVEEVLNSQPEQVRTFLLDTAVLGQLTGPLCDALTGRDDGQHMLAVLERDNLFVVPLDDAAALVPLPPPLRRRAAGPARRRAPDRVQGLHRAAARWYAEHGRPDHAIAHAVAGHDFEHAADLDRAGPARGPPAAAGPDPPALDRRAAGRRRTTPPDPQRHGRVEPARRRRRGRRGRPAARRRRQPWKRRRPRRGPPTTSCGSCP